MRLTLALNFSVMPCHINYPQSILRFLSVARSEILSKYRCIIRGCDISWALRRESGDDVRRMFRSKPIEPMKSAVAHIKCELDDDGAHEYHQVPMSEV